MKPSSERRFDLDWLRVLSILLLIPFHVTLIFVLDSNSIMYVSESAPLLPGLLLWLPAARFHAAIDPLTWVALAYGIFEAFFRILVPQWYYAEWGWEWVSLGLMYELGLWSLTQALLGLGHRS